MSHLLHDANIFVTGGAGTLGRAIAKRRQQEGWKGRLTVYSTDDHKHDVMRRTFPDQGIDYIQGDIRNAETLYMAMCGHDVVIHAAAVKVIPVSEVACMDTIDVNINGSMCVCLAAVRAKVNTVIGISTDKACHPANLYGATKMAMEKVFQEYARKWARNNMTGPRFMLVRYGNVLESTGSVIEMWKKARERGEAVKITNPSMTRFWLSPSQAVDHVISTTYAAPGDIFIPKMPALSIGKLAEYTVGWPGDGTMQPVPMETIPMRPGEKMHETLLTVEECDFAREISYFPEGRPDDVHVAYVLWPSTAERNHDELMPYSSDVARELTRPELVKMLQDG